MVFFVLKMTLKDGDEDDKHNDDDDNNGGMESLVAHVSSTAVEGGLGSVERDRGGWSLGGIAWSNEESEILNRRSRNVSTYPAR